MECAEDQVDLPDTVKTVADLLAWLGERSAAFQDIIQGESPVHVAVDQRHAGPATSVTGAKEIALFPPVTGG